MLADLTEKQWQAQVVQLARQLGWQHVYHTFDSRRSAHGFPDLVLVRDRLVVCELKTERGKLSDAQKEWLRALLEAGVEAYVLRPRQLHIFACVLMPAPTQKERELCNALRHETLEELAA